jgi:hypothetical protein
MINRWFCVCTDGASGSSTGSDRLNLNLGLGVPSGKGKYQQGEPHIDTTSPLGADACKRITSHFMSNHKFFFYSDHVLIV